MIADCNQHLLISVLHELLTLQAFGSIQNPPFCPPSPKTVVLPSPERHIWKDTYIAKFKLWEATQSQDTGSDTGRTESERVLLYAIYDKYN